MPPNNYLDFGKGSDLTKPIITLLDQEDSQNPGSLLRFMRLEQINDDHSLLTAYLTEDSWGALQIPSSGIVGESRFLIDGADIKSRLNFEPWNSNPLRLKSTRRKAVRLECLLNLNNNSDLIDNIESNLYSGAVEEFQTPNHITWDEATTGYLTDPFKFRKRTSILNVFSKYTNDKNHRYVWFHLEEDFLAAYGSEYSGGDAGISIMKVSSPLAGPILDKETNGSPLITKFSMPARHLGKVFQLVTEHSPLSFRLDTTRKYVQFWSSAGWFVFPNQEEYLSKTLAVNAPIYLNQHINFEKSSQRMYSAQELANKVAMQKPTKKTDGDGLRLVCTDSHLVLSKISDILQRELSYAMFADLTGEETPWEPIVVYQTYFLAAITAILKYCKQLTEDEVYESGTEVYTDFDFSEEQDDYLLLTNETGTAEGHLLTMTQHYLPNKDMWCVFIDPVPYSEECVIYLAASTPAKSHDRSEDNI